MPDIPDYAASGVCTEKNPLSRPVSVAVTCSQYLAQATKSSYPHPSSSYHTMMSNTLVAYYTSLRKQAELLKQRLRCVQI